MIQKLIYKITSSRTLRFLFASVMVFVLSGCETDGDDSLGEDQNYNANATCWQTKIVNAVLSIIDVLYKTSANKVTEGGPAVICICFAIWMSFKILKTLPSFKEENLGEVWTEIGQKLFICIFCAWIVYTTGNIDWSLQTFLIPVYNTIAELGLQVLSSLQLADSSDLGEYGKVVYPTVNYGQCKVNVVDMNSLKTALATPINCLACAVSDRLNSGVKIGVALISSGNIGAIFIGLLVVVLFTIVKFCFIFVLVDGLFRLNFAAFLLPVLILAIPFNYTRKWSKHVFLMFLNSSGIMLFITLLISISIGALQNIMNTLGPQLDEGNVEGGGPMLLAILLISVLLVNIPDFGISLADKFIGGGGGVEFQKKVSKFVIRNIKKAGYKVLSIVSEGATTKFTDTLEKYQATREAVDSARQIKKKIDSFAGKNDDD